MKKIKAQGALEFLMTYGWAFLVILIMIGALAYFGVLNPQRFLPDRCQFGNPVLCKREQFTVRSEDTGTVIAKLVNNFGTAVVMGDARVITDIPGVCETAAVTDICMNSTTLDCTPAGGGVDVAPASAFTLFEGESANLIIDCTDGGSGLSPGDKVKFIIKMKWYPTTSSITFQKDLQGEVYASVQ